MPNLCSSHKVFKYSHLKQLSKAGQSPKQETCIIQEKKFQEMNECSNNDQGIVSQL